MPLTNKKINTVSSHHHLKTAILNVDQSMASFLNVPCCEGVFTSVAKALAVWHYRQRFWVKRAFNLLRITSQPAVNRMRPKLYENGHFPTNPWPL